MCSSFIFITYARSQAGSWELKPWGTLHGGHRKKKRDGYVISDDGGISQREATICMFLFTHDLVIWIKMFRNQTWNHCFSMQIELVQLLLNYIPAQIILSNLPNCRHRIGLTFFVSLEITAQLSLNQAPITNIPLGPHSFEWMDVFLQEF